MTDSHWISRRAALAGLAAGTTALATPGLLRGATMGTLRVSTALRLANYMPAYIAAREGIFAENGIDVSIDAAGSIAEPVAILNAGRADIAMTGTGMAVNSSVEGSTTRVIAKLAGGIGLWMVSKKGSGISSLEDLKGKRIASFRFPSNTVSSPTFAMQKYGGFEPSEHDVTFVEGPPGSIIPAVLDGRADAGAAFEWTASIAEQVHDLEVSLSLAEVIGPIAFTTAMANEATLEEKPEMVQAYVDSLAQAMRLIRSDESVYARVAGQEFDQVPAEAIAAASTRLMSTPGVVPESPVVTEAEYDAIVEHETTVGTMRQAMSYDEIVVGDFANASG